MLFGNNVKLTSELKEALGRVDKVLGDRNKIEGAIRKAEAQTPAAEAALASAMDALATAETEAALADQPANTDSLRKAISRARESVDALTLRASGLRRKLLSQEEEILAAEQQLLEARKEWRKQRLSDYEAEYMAAAKVFAAVVRNGVALAGALDRSHIAATLKECKAPHLSDRGIELIRTEGKYLRDQQRHESLWESDPGAKAVYESHVGVLRQVQIIGQLAKPIRARREAEAERADDARRENEPQRRTTSLGGIPEPPAPDPPRVEIIPTTPFPNNPERRSGYVQTAHMYPSAAKSVREETEAVIDGQKA